MFFFFFFNDTATTEIYTLSLHDALPIFETWHGRVVTLERMRQLTLEVSCRSEEHTSELQSPMYLVCRLLLEKKKKHDTIKIVQRVVAKNRPNHEDIEANSIASPYHVHVE